MRSWFTLGRVVSLVCLVLAVIALAHGWGSPAHLGVGGMLLIGATAPRDTPKFRFDRNARNDDEVHELMRVAHQPSPAHQPRGHTFHDGVKAALQWISGGEAPYALVEADAMETNQTAPPPSGPTRPTTGPTSGPGGTTGAV